MLSKVVEKIKDYKFGQHIANIKIYGIIQRKLKTSLRFTQGSRKAPVPPRRITLGTAETVQAIKEMISCADSSSFFRFSA